MLFAAAANGTPRRSPQSIAFDRDWTRSGQRAALEPNYSAANAP